MTHATFRIELPSMTPGSARHVVVHRFGRRGARPKVYLQAAVHANELPGVMALHHLMPRLLKADAAGRVAGEVVVVPTVNPIGLSQLVGNNHLGRYDQLGRDNFNRNWPDLAPAVAERVAGRLGSDAAANVALVRQVALAVLGEMRPMNELQTLRAEVMKLSIDADVVLDLHCDLEALLHLFISRRDWPGAAQALAADLGAEATLVNDPYPQSSTFSAANGALWARLAERFPQADIPQACLSATVEYRGQHDVNHALGAADAAKLLRFLQRRGAVAGRPGALPPLQAEATPIAGMDVGYCPCSGMLVYRVAKGERVRKGQVVCEIIDTVDARGPQARVPLRAGGEGVLFSRRLDGTLAWPGKTAFRIAGPKPLPHRAGMSGLDD
jgi:predicted deacylase